LTKNVESSFEISSGEQTKQAVRELYQGFLIWDKATAFGLILLLSMQFSPIFRSKMGNLLQFFLPILVLGQPENT
jgi:hypothetical protein